MNEQVSKNAQWYQIELTIPAFAVASFSDAVLEQGALSVSVEDAHAGTEYEQPVFSEPGSMGDTEEPEVWVMNRVSILVELNCLIPELLEQASLIANLKQLPHWRVDGVQQQDWVRLTQNQFAPLKVGKSIWVVPSWHQTNFDPRFTQDQANVARPENKISGIVLQLDPGLAFGTGSHPTTQLCMEMLEDLPLQQKMVLDYGCGSGILALLCAKLGASRVVAVDIDPQALEAAHHNASKNERTLECYDASTFHVEHFDFIVANILAKPLQLLAPVLSSCIKPGGQLLLSGILSTQVEQVTEAYKTFLDLSIAKEHEGWVLLVGKRQYVQS